jgi:hypothetical protein
MIQAQALIEILEDAGREPFPYSGRSMYGDECVGFRISEDESVAGVTAEICLFADLDVAPAHEIHNVFLSAKVDQLGKGLVMYFPRVTILSDWRIE